MLYSDTIKSMVASALKEDIGAIDVSASLLKNNVVYKANLIAREEFILCGVAYADEVLLQVDKNITIGQSSKMELSGVINGVWVAPAVTI